jgi:transcriptional regulator with XRE-family HTH domain
MEGKQMASATRKSPPAAHAGPPPKPECDWGRRVLSFAKPRGMSRRQLAAVCGVDPSTFGRWMSGETTVPLYAGELLADAFGVSMDELRTLPKTRRVAR